MKSLSLCLGAPGRGAILLLTCVLAVFAQTAGAVPRYVCAEALIAARHAAGAIPAARAKPAASAPLSRVTALVVFTGFRGQPTGVPSWAGSLFDPDRPGSVSHFYREMSFGSLTLRGTVAPRRYLASGDASDYTAAGPTELGRYSEFVREILRQVDDDLDLAVFDDDGPDGRPDSGDDDGEVDLVVVLTPSLPRNFLFGGATGIRDLGLLETVATSDPGAGGRPIGYRTGLVAQGRTFAEAAGTVAHELGHTLFALPDLYNVAYLNREGPPDPAGDSAGIGNWGLMGWGALGWGGDDGPVGFSAWSRLRLGWARVTEAADPSQRILLRDVAETGELVRIPLGGEEYFLLEYRTRSSFYDRGIPAEGLLVWHVMSNPTGEVTRAHWLVDLECADGRWTEAGFPLGRTPDPLHGGDNLDFWAHDADYAEAHAGNLGDATDVFGPGGRTAFTAASNPGSADREGRGTCSITAIEVTERGGGGSSRGRRAPHRVRGLLLPGSDRGRPAGGRRGGGPASGPGQPGRTSPLRSHPDTGVAGRPAHDHAGAPRAAHPAAGRPPPGRGVRDTPPGSWSPATSPPRGWRGCGPRSSPAATPSAAGTCRSP